MYISHPKCDFWCILAPRKTEYLQHGYLPEPAPTAPEQQYCQMGVYFPRRFGESSWAIQPNGL